MAAANETEILEIKQEPPSPETAEEQSFCNDDIPSSPSNANLSSEHDDLPPASDFLSIQIKEEPSSPGKDSPPIDPTPCELHRNPVPISCLASSMMAANHASIDEEMVEEILPDRRHRTPSPELTFEMTATIKEEIDWDSTDSARQGAENHNVLEKVKVEPVDWESRYAIAEEQSSSAVVVPPAANHSTKAVYLVRTASAGKSVGQSLRMLKRKQDYSDADSISSKQLLTDATGGQSVDILQMKTYHQRKTSLENRIEDLQNEKAEYEAKIKANTKASKLDKLQADADRGVVKAKFLLDQLRCYGKGSYDWSEETLSVCKQWAKKFPQDYKQCSVDFLTLPTLSEMGIKAGDSVYEASAELQEDAELHEDEEDVPEDSECSD